MKENRVQFDLIMWFGQNFPRLQNMLILIDNDAYTIEKAMYKRSMGISKGAPDLILLFDGSFLGLEIKAPGSIHSTEHINQQLNFGQEMMNQGGWYFMSSDLNELKSVILSFMQDLSKMKFISESNIHEISLKLNKKKIKF